MLESQIPMLDRSNETPAQDGYDMRGQGRNPMMHPSMQSAIGGRNMDSNQMHPGMDRMNMNRMRGGMHNGMMNPMGGYGNMPSMNGSHGSFNDDRVGHLDRIIDLPRMFVYDRPKPEDFEV